MRASPSGAGGGKKHTSEIQNSKTFRIPNRHIARSLSGAWKLTKSAGRAITLGSTAGLAGSALVYSSEAHAKTPVVKAPVSEAPNSTAKPPTLVDLESRRLVAIGDLHGDLLQALRALRIAGLVDDSGRKWIGGTTVLVQVGDIFDRGDDELRLLTMFRSLKKQAEAAGGAIYTLNGNHEIMNVAGDFRYATPGALERFNKLYLDKGGKNGAPGDPKKAESVGAARYELLKPGSALAREMAANPTVLQVGDSLFAHAGILPEHVEYGMERINQEVAGWMEGRSPRPPRQVIEASGVVWNRDYGEESSQLYGPGGACKRLDSVLKSTGSKRMFIGHTPQGKGANVECSGKLWRIDVGQSRGIMGQPPEVVEIVDGKVKVIKAELQRA